MNFPQPCRRDPYGWSRLPLVWILPVVVVLAGGFVVIRRKNRARHRRSKFALKMPKALEANKTKIRYKDVDIGEVRDIHVSARSQGSDRHRRSSIAMPKPYLVDDTRFWVVRPRISGAGVSRAGHAGIGRLHQRRCGQFGDEPRPLRRSRSAAHRDLRSARQGIHPTCRRSGVFDIGSSVFYQPHRRGPGGGLYLDPGGTGVTIKVFINAPFDALRHRRDAILAGERHRHVRQLGRSEAAHRVPRIHSGRRRRVSERRRARRSRESRRTRHLPFLHWTRTARCAPPKLKFSTFVMYFGGSLRGLSAGRTGGSARHYRRRSQKPRCGIRRARETAGLSRRGGVVPAKAARTGAARHTRPSAPSIATPTR